MFYKALFSFSDQKYAFILLFFKPSTSLLCLLWKSNPFVTKCDFWGGIGRNPQDSGPNILVDDTVGFSSQR